MSPRGVTDARFAFCYPSAQGVNEIIGRGGRGGSLDQLPISSALFAPSSIVLHPGRKRRFIRAAFPAAYIGLLYRIDMTGLRVGRSKIISNAIVPPLRPPFPSPPLDKPCLRVSPKFSRGKILEIVETGFIHDDM